MATHVSDLVAEALINLISCKGSVYNIINILDKALGVCYIIVEAL